MGLGANERALSGVLARGWDVLAVIDLLNGKRVGHFDYLIFVRFGGCLDFLFE